MLKLLKFYQKSMMKLIKKKIEMKLSDRIKEFF